LSQVGRNGLGAHNRRLGTSGEDLAAAWYERAGYQVVARNWRCRDGELDLVAVGRGAVVFTEVKTRSSSRFGVPAEAVSPTKQRRIRGLAARFLREHPQRAGELRFDVVSILDGQLSVLEAAF
jgi:putative endonuclease